MQEAILGELIFVGKHAGPVFVLARIQDNIFEELSSTYPQHTKCEIPGNPLQILSKYKK